jgi:predicted anti-sigma-YlaC factor YlaD
MVKHPVTALVPYLREELGDGERAYVARHLEGCAECRELSNSLAGISADLARWIERIPAPDPSVYRAQLGRKLASQQEPRQWFRWPRFSRVSMAALGVSAIALLAILSIQRQSRLPSVEQLATGNEISDAGIGLLRNYPVVSNLELLENYDVIEHLNELHDEDVQHHAA